jgi:hypothetical protein
VLSRAMQKAIDKRSESARRLAAELRRCRGIVEPREGHPGEPRAPHHSDDLLPLEEERGGAGLWWLLALLGAGVGAALYYFVR